MSSQPRIAVTGATGRVGRHVVNLLETDRYEVVPISRSSGVDVVTGEGLAEALAGVTTVVDAATGPSPDEDAATEFFTSEAHNLQEYGKQAGVQGIVVVSIIGINRFTTGYNAAKQAHERVSTSGPVPARILRAAQFHEFVPVLVGWGRNGVVSYVPPMRTQLVAARAVAKALVELATETDWADSPPRSIPEIAGPREERLADAARLLVERSGDDIRIEELENPAIGEADLIANGALLPGLNATLAGPSFEQWLNEEYA
jgi:uncharacterized protein YbjT (DUF2867 family)